MCVCVRMRVKIWDELAIALQSMNQSRFQTSSVTFVDRVSLLRSNSTERSSTVYVDPAYNLMPSRSKMYESSLDVFDTGSEFNVDISDSTGVESPEIEENLLFSFFKVLAGYKTRKMSEDVKEVEEESPEFERNESVHSEKASVIYIYHFLFHF